MLALLLIIAFGVCVSLTGRGLRRDYFGSAELVGFGLLTSPSWLFYMLSTVVVTVGTGYHARICSLGSD